MKYSDLLRSAIERADLTLPQICRRVALLGQNINKSYLSKLQTGHAQPARDAINESLAEVLAIDPLDLRTAAYLERIPSDVVERIRAMAEPN